MATLKQRIETLETARTGVVLIDSESKDLQAFYKAIGYQPRGRIRYWTTHDGITRNAEEFRRRHKLEKN